eukprot:jgi/Chrpa1/1756/Chrysochromulina_OHIO_Genome00008689-RA
MAGVGKVEVVRVEVRAGAWAGAARAAEARVAAK